MSYKDLLIKKNELNVALDLIDPYMIGLAVGLIKNALDLNRTVYLIGNGGSASTAEHLANDLSSKLVRAVCLASNGSRLTALANDYGYKKIYSMQLGPVDSDDVLIAISTSGNSENIIEAVGMFPAKVIGMTGLPGGALVDMTPVCLIAKSSKVDLIEDIHLIMGHMIVGEV